MNPVTTYTPRRNSPAIQRNPGEINKKNPGSSPARSATNQLESPRTFAERRSNAGKHPYGLNDQDADLLAIGNVNVDDIIENSLAATKSIQQGVFPGIDTGEKYSLDLKHLQDRLNALEAAVNSSESSTEQETYIPETREMRSQPRSSDSRLKEAAKLKEAYETMAASLGLNPDTVRQLHEHDRAQLVGLIIRKAEGVRPKATSKRQGRRGEVHDNAPKARETSPTIRVRMFGSDDTPGGQTPRSPRALLGRILPFKANKN